MRAFRKGIQKMNSRIITYDEIRQDVAGIVDEVKTGGTVLVQEANQPVAAIISYADFMALREQLEDLEDIRIAEAALEEYRRDPSTAIPWETVKAELRAEGLLDGE
jgi:prevent-host-death family protein